MKTHDDLEEIYKETLSFAGFGIYMLNLDGTILYIDETAFSIFGLNEAYPNPASVLGKNIDEHIATKVAMEKLIEKITTCSQVNRFEYMFKTVSGQQKQIRHDAQIIPNKKIIRGVVREIPISDISSTLEKNDVSAYNIMLNEIDKEMNMLLYAISHDLRAPLRSINGFSQAIIEDYSEILDEIGRDFLQRIQNSSKLLDQYIEALLIMSRETRGEIIIEDVDISAMVKEILAELTESEETRKSEIIIQENIIAKADQRLIKILLQKILDNAWKFTAKNDQARIEFGTISKNDNLFYFIQDNGIGFDMKYAQPRLFGVFQKLHTDKAFANGLGTGLATARRIINRHGGSIFAESEVNKGTTICFSL